MHLKTLRVLLKHLQEFNLEGVQIQSDALSI